MLSFPFLLLFVFYPMVGGFLRILGFYKSLQVRQACLPQKAILFQPRVDRPQRLGVELVEAMAAFAPFLDEMRPP
jgi:hypothetical protein